MKLKKNSGHIVHEQLSYTFNMLQLGGSDIQKYDTVKKEFLPNRGVTPYVLQPSLLVSDPEGKIPSVDQVGNMVNVKWTVTLYTTSSSSEILAEGNGYEVGEMYKLTLYKNCEIGQRLNIEFYGEFYDANRGQKSPFHWSTDLTTLEESSVKLSLDVDAPGKLNLSPFKDRGEFAIKAQAYNDNEAIEDDWVNYVWQMYDETTKAFIDIADDELWYVSGKDTKSIKVNQDFIQKVLLRVKATSKYDTTQTESKTILLRRFYGMYDPESFFENGKYIFDDNQTIAIGAKVSNRQGNISKPTKYFDMEIFYQAGKNAEWKSVGYGEEAIVTRDEKSNEHEIGILCRELSAYRPIELPDGTMLALQNDDTLVAQFPISTREVE